MSKLRADITWKHRINSNLPVSTPIKIINDIEEEDNENDDNIEIEENIEKNLEEEEEDENLADLEEELGDYLQGWSEMLEEETYEFEENENEIVHIEINNILHPAIDSNAKWKLDSLFKKLQFPF